MYKLSFLFISLACFVNKGKSENKKMARDLLSFTIMHSMPDREPYGMSRGHKVSHGMVS